MQLQLFHANTWHIQMELLYPTVAQAAHLTNEHFEFWAINLLCRGLSIATKVKESGGFFSFYFFLL